MHIANVEGDNKSYIRNCKKKTLRKTNERETTTEKKTLTTHSKASNNDPDLLKIELCFIDT